MSRPKLHGDGPLPEQRQYRPAGRACFPNPLRLGKQKLAPYVFEKDMIDEAMAMVQKHIARIHQIVYFEEMHRGILGLFNDLTIWTTKLFREMFGKIKADTPRYVHLKRTADCSCPNGSERTKTFSRPSCTYSTRKVDGSMKWMPSGLPALWQA